MRIDFLTLFPEMCKTVMDESIIGRAQKRALLRFAIIKFEIMPTINITVWMIRRLVAEWECFYVRNHLHCVWMT